ncbi:carbonyl reductase [NADPH] 1-like [Lycorma delicatula]|uniref:carbonyl reductase [NADPH] 1-like n=1 Tax=Lycorma delicatula TaxID=130591 RepID=UPI003F50F44B
MAKSNPVAVVTGANRGIGFEVVKGLCKEFKGNGTIYLTARNEERGKAAVEELHKYDCYPEFYQLDVKNISRTFDLKEEILLKRHGGFDILVNNAATMYVENSSVPFYDLAENVLALNFFYTLHITGLLWASLRPYARVVNVASAAANISKIRSEEIRSRFLDPTLSFRRLMVLMNDYLKAVKKGKHIEEGWPESPYDVSKMGVVAMTRVQQYQFDKRERKKRIIVNCVHPGFVKTRTNNFTGNLTPEEGASPIIKLALLPPNISSPKGQFVWNDLRIVDWASGKLHTNENLANL